MKKVVFLVPWLSGYGGTETVIHNLFKEYYKNESKIDFDFELYSLGGFLRNTNLHFKNIHVIQLFNNKFLRELIYIFLLPLLIPYIILKKHADSIISTNPILWLLSKLFIEICHLKIPVIAWYQYPFKAKHVSKFYLKQPDYYFVITKASKIELINEGINKNRIFVVYNPVIPSKYIIKHSSYNNQLIYVGRIEYSKAKNVKDLFKALSMLNKQHWTLRIYGKGSKRDVSLLKHLSLKLGINNHIKWMGFKKNVFHHINNADSLILTSNYEGFSMVIAESIAHGLYVISSDCNGPKELVNKYNGDLYHRHNLRQLSSLINNVLNGKQQRDPIVAKRSISYMYINNYFKNYIYSLSIVMKKDEN